MTGIECLWMFSMVAAAGGLSVDEKEWNVCVHATALSIIFVGCMGSSRLEELSVDLDAYRFVLQQNAKTKIIKIVYRYEGSAQNTWFIWMVCVCASDGIRV